MGDTTLKLSLLFALTFLAAAVTLPGSKSDPVTQRLSHADVFAFGGIGFASVISQGEMDYRIIALRPSAEADFEYLFLNGTPAAKCYGLVRIQKLSEPTFNSLAGSIKPALAKSAVTTMQGCLMWPSSLGVILKSLKAGAYPG